ncbi:hypothetical protein KY328_05865 [Candidatus Woesearchaeota archaeon]|nr:hypothetical protein [Candidatus Woesearchaeota archaeon]MBW3022426.1 hypothetical protein [Candidatus Woesearchaeota archaeon]
MARKSLIVGLAALTLLAGSYLYSPKVQHSVNKAAFNAYLTINPDPIPSITDVPAVARYVDRNIAPVGDFKPLGKNLVFYFPDTHCTSTHNKHYNRIKKLHKAFGKSPVFIEGALGKFDASVLKEELEATLKNQEKGKYSHLASVEAELTGNKPRKIHNLNDLLDVSPLFRFSASGLYGVEDRKNALQSRQITYLKKAYSYYFDRCKAKSHVEDALKQNYDDEKFIEKTLRDMNTSLKKRGISKAHELDILKRKAKVPKFMGRLVKSRNELQSLKKNIDHDLNLLTHEMDKHLNELKPDYVFAPYSVDKSLETTQESGFYRQLLKAEEKAVMDARSSSAANLTLENMKRLNVQHAMIVYGQDHARQILDELRRLGVSYISIGKKAKPSLGPKILDALANQNVAPHK